jgi:outer membrane protein
MKQKFGILFILMTLCMPISVSAAPIESQHKDKVLSLEDCLELGYANSQDLKLVAENSKVAMEDIRQAAGEFWPTFSYAIKYDKADSETFVRWVPTSSDFTNWERYYADDHIYSGSLSFKWSLYTGGKLTNNLKVALLKFESVKEDGRAARQQLAYNIKKSFYNLWLAKQALRVAQDSCQNLLLHYQQIKRLYDAGIKAMYDVLKAEVEWKKAQAKLVSAENSVESEELNLGTLIGNKLGNHFEISREDSLLHIAEQVTPSFPVLVEEAYCQRPEIHQCIQKVEIAKLELAMAKSEYKPIVSFNGTYLKENENDGQSLTSNWDDSWRLSLTINGRIYDKAITSSKIKKAKNNVNIAIINDTRVREQIQQKVQEAIHDLKESQSSITTNKANIELTKETMRVTEKRFAIGMATIVDISDSQLSVDEALTGYYKGISSYFIALANLDYVLGRDF